MDRIIIIPLTVSYPRTLHGQHETMAMNIQSLIGIEPRCEFDIDKLVVTFTEEQWKDFMKYYPKKWRSNLTHEIKKELKRENIKPDLRNLKIVQ